jgi:hypothetical protein
MEENKKLNKELEKANSSLKPKFEGLFSRKLNTVDGVLSGFRPVRDVETNEISATTLETLRPPCFFGLTKFYFQ